MDYKHLNNLWPAPDIWSESNESLEGETSRLYQDRGISLIERTAIQSVIQYEGHEGYFVQGTQKDYEIACEANCSLDSAIAALKQIAFYAYMGRRIPAPLADHLARAVDAMADEYENNPNSAIDDSIVATQCLKVLGSKLGILGGHKRPTASYQVVGMYYEDIFEKLWDKHSSSAKKRLEQELVSYDEWLELEGEAMELAENEAFEAVKSMFNLSKQQTARLLKKFEWFRDHREPPK